jgi:biotin carboxyl carrier protein
MSSNKVGESSYRLKIEKKLGVLFLSTLCFVFLGFVLFYNIEVVAPGRGITVIKGSDVVIKSPESAYVKTLFVSQAEFVNKGDPLLTYRNLDDEYLLEKTKESLDKNVARKRIMEQEMCFFYSSIFADATPDYLPKLTDCDARQLKVSQGGQYVYQFYKDYTQEKIFFSNSSLERVKRKKELLQKRSILYKKRNALSKGGAETVRFYDLQSEISDLNGEVISYGLIALENEKKLEDKLSLFKMKRAERALELKQEYENIENKILEESHQVELLSEKKKLSIINSPVTGNVLRMMEGVSVDTFIEEGAELFVLKKEGVSTQIKAKFDSRYRAHLYPNAKVKIKITSPGKNYFFLGKIKNVSSDSLEKEDNNPAAGRYYEATILPEERFLDAEINLGIDTEVFVISKRATIFDYILSVFPSYTKLEVW